MDLSILSPSCRAGEIQSAFASSASCLGDELSVVAGPGPELQRGEGGRKAKLMMGPTLAADDRSHVLTSMAPQRGPLCVRNAGKRPGELRASPELCCCACFLVTVRWKVLELLGQDLPTHVVSP